jgi:hypothetical protein
MFNASMSRFIEATNKPRLLKQGRAWLCMGMRRRWISRKFVMKFGDTPHSAYEAWKKISDA